MNPLLGDAPRLARRPPMLAIDQRDGGKHERRSLGCVTAALSILHEAQDGLNDLSDGGAGV
jgi:hypothetical protein